MPFWRRRKVQKLAEDHRLMNISASQPIEVILMKDLQSNAGIVSPSRASKQDSLQ